MNTQTAKLMYLHIAPRKVRLIANVIKGLPVNEAEAQLLVRSQRSVRPILKLLRSAVANAINNKKMDKDKLIVTSILVNQGTVFKRFMPRAQGRATPILKKTSHIILTLGEIDKKLSPKFNIVPKKPKTKKEKAKAKKEKIKTNTAIETREKPKKVGFIRRMFSRKSV